MSDDRVESEKIARLFHETYEELAPSFSYETRKESAVPWEQVPENNRNLMIAVAVRVVGFLGNTRTLDPSIESLQAEVEDLKHDLDRYMKIANIECNEAEDLRHILRAARPYISDRAGIGIIGAIDQALAAKEQSR